MPTSQSSPGLTFYPFGSFAAPTYDLAAGLRQQPVWMGLDLTGEALRKPTGYTQIWNDMVR